MSNAVQLFTAPDGEVQLSVSMDKETVWLSLDQMVQLFERDKSVVSRHLRNLFAEGELVRTSVVAKNATTAADGKTYQVDYYNLDVVISVGYRVKSGVVQKVLFWGNTGERNPPTHRGREFTEKDAIGVQARRLPGQVRSGAGSPKPSSVNQCGWV